MEKKILGVLSQLTDKIDSLDSKVDNLNSELQIIKQEQQEMKQDIRGIKQEQQEMKQDIRGIKQELQTFHENSEQNFAIIINHTREQRAELSEMRTKMDNELAHLEQKTDVMQTEVIRVKQRQYATS